MIRWSINQQEGKKIKKEFFQNIITTTFKVLKIYEADISIAIISESAIKKANYLYKNKKEITDVLSFVYEKKPLEGEVLICYKRALKQAKENKHGIEDEIKILLVHALLHLAGYTHSRKQDALKMKALENKILQKLLN